MVMWLFFGVKCVEKIVFLRVVCCVGQLLFVGIVQICGVLFMFEMKVMVCLFGEKDGELQDLILVRCWMRFFVFDVVVFGVLREKRIRNSVR